MLEGIQNRPLYSIGVVSELLNVHPETIRSWERSGVLRPPHRRRGKRLFSTADFRRLQFVQKLADEGLSLRAMHFYLRLYPCWQADECTECMHNSEAKSYTKPCWKEPGTYCTVSNTSNLCSNCANAERKTAEVTPPPWDGHDAKDRRDIEHGTIVGADGYVSHRDADDS